MGIPSHSSIAPAETLRERTSAFLSLSLTGTLRVIRRAVPKFQRLNSQDLPLFSIG